MRKNNTMRLAALLLVLTLITSCFVGGTFAKYTSTAAGEDTVTVAKWSIIVNNAQIAVDNPAITFALFETINDSGNTADETDVSDKRIAPGTAGSFALEVKNDSEVTAKYSIEYAVENESDVPLEFSTDGTTWTSDLTTLKTENAQLAIGADATTTNVQWRWQYENNADDTDTALGIAAQTTAPEVTITATITATQVD